MHKIWPSKPKVPDQKAMETQEREAVAGARDALARVIADGNHSDRSRAIDSIQAVDRGWHDERQQYSVTHRLSRVYDARFDLLGGFSENTDTLPSEASNQMQVALYALDHLAALLLTRLAALGVAVYPTMDAPAGQMRELPSAEPDALLSSIEQGHAD